MADNTFLAPLSPIQRSTPSDRLLTFQKNERSIYNKFSPYDQAGGDIGPNQPYIYTKLTDSNFQKSLTRYDTPAFPVGSTVRDVIRMTKFSVSGTGLLYAGKQLLLQQQNAFNETRVYNPLSLLKATARPGSLGLIDYPQRHLETSGGLLNFFKDALYSTLGIQSKDTTNAPIEGTATGAQGGLAYSQYAGKHGGARAGLLRYKTATSAMATFDTFWVSSNTSGGSSGGFLENLAKGFLNKLKSLIPSTNPMGAFGGNTGTKWEFRPEYGTNLKGIYYKFLADGNKNLSVNIWPAPEFRNGKVYDAQITRKNVTAFHKYSPEESTKISPANPLVIDNGYASNRDIAQNRVGELGNNILDKYKKMMDAVEKFDINNPIQLRVSTERYWNETQDSNGVLYSSYQSIPNQGDVNNTFSGKMVDTTSIEKRKFAVASKYSDIKSGKTSTNSGDTYNASNVISIKGSSNSSKKGQDIDPIKGIGNDSTDIIFFYFYDLINEVFIPFRATLGSITDQNSPEWEDVKYMGRADRLFIYRGFSRDVSFNFKVYANSIKELIPMWERVNYLVGLTRPSKYTDRAVVTNEETINRRESIQQNLELAQLTGDQGNIDNLSTDLSTLNTTGRESEFIYPPMIEFRIGDLYVDQPAVLSSVSVTIPDDAQWEMLRADEYQYNYGGPDKIIKTNALSRQLPNIIDVSVQLRMLEKSRSLTGNYHYGPSVTNGWKSL
jgi:hypothetical protein